MIEKNITTRSGYAAMIGRPNVGKSTLLNHLLGFKLSITSAKPQTTRHQLLGIDTGAQEQIVYVDTPGLHQRQKKALNRYLNTAAMQALFNVDVIVFVVDVTQWQPDDDWVVSQLEKVTVPIILALNKIDRLPNKAALLPKIQEYQARLSVAEVVPLSALKGDNLTALRQQIIKYLPVGPFLFPKDKTSNQSEAFIATEIIREKLTRLLAKELPYSLTVTIEAWVDEADMVRISAVIWVERDSHKPIVIGKGGLVLKKVGQQARADLEAHFDQKVYLQLWVKVKSGWSDNDTMLRTLGYQDE